MEKMKKFIECLIPVTKCNIKCSYCYVIQENRRAGIVPELDYDLDTIQKALTKERFGGTCYFSLCGAGETLIPEYVIDIAYRLLENGHYVNITTNGTLTKRFEQIIEKFPKEYLARLHFAFSLHYIELKRLNALERFFDNVDRIRKNGCSFVIQINLCDEYYPYLDEIKRICMERVQAMPQVAVTRKESKYPKMQIDLYTDKTEEEYIKNGKSFDSPLFEYTLKNFKKKRKEFCYAGDWAYQLNLKNGLLKRCYCSCVVQNIFKDINKPIFTCAVGKFCNSDYCFNSSHFVSLGVIPEIKGPSYADLRNRECAGWYKENMKEFLSGKLSDTNEQYGIRKKIKTEFAGIYDKLAYQMYLRLLAFLNKRKEKRNCED